MLEKRISEKDNPIALGHIMSLIFQAVDDKNILVVIFRTLAIVLTGGPSQSIQQSFLGSFSIIIELTKILAL